MTAWLVPPREWPITAWSFVAYLLWMHCCRGPWSIESKPALWLLSWCGYWAYHPCHDGMSMADVAAMRAGEAS